uniref:Intracellular protein transport protein USO1-related n=1 Tax=Zea mays TaxID=4577 RepID=A0A804P2E0_MAIZE
MEPPAPAAPRGAERAEAVAAEPASGAGARVEVPLRLRLGRARRRAGPVTPTPSWKMEDDGVREGPSALAPAAASAAARRSSASARQLGASLWEIHDVAREVRRSRRRGGRAIAAGREHGGGGELDQSSGGIRRHVADSSMKHHKFDQERSHRIQPFSPASYTSSVGDSNVNLTRSPTRSLGIMGRSMGEGYSLKTSTELLKVLNRIWSLEEQHTANLSVVNGLKLELQQAQTHIQELLQERRQYRHEVSSLMRQLSENKLVRKNKDHMKVDTAVRSLQGELEDEKRLRRHSEDLLRKLGMELSEIKSAFLKSVKDLEKEKKGNRLLEDLCDQFAMGIRNYEEELRVVKQRNVKNYELKFDNSVLHMSELWLDERMQMQNTDVNGELAHKTTITERLSGEIQAFLLSKKAGSSMNNEKHMNDNTRLRRQSLESVHLNGATSAPQFAEDDDDSIASDLNCFELNMHGHMGSRRSGTGAMNVHKRRSEHPHVISAEGLCMSSVPVYLQKGIARPSSSKLQPASKIPEISSQSNARITPAEEQNGSTGTQIIQGSNNGSTMNNPDAHHVDYLGQESFDHFSRTSLFCEGTTSGDLGNVGSPTRQLKYQSTSLDPEITECSPEQPVGVMENTLKAKLLQARLEGRHARLKASGGSSTSRRK